MMKTYTPPTLQIIRLTLEGSISAGSAKVNPQNASQEIYVEWTTDDDRETLINW